MSTASPDQPRGAAKLLALNWPLVLLLGAVAGAGFLMLYSVAGGSYAPGPGRRSPASWSGSW